VPEAGRRRQGEDRMSSWPSYEELPASLPDSTPKKVPEANKLARMIRTGRTVSDLSVRYNVQPREIMQRLTAAGWDVGTGLWTGGDPKDYRAAPLAVKGEGPGQSCHHVGGGDNPNVVPLKPPPYRERSKPEGFRFPPIEKDPTVRKVAPRIYPHEPTAGKLSSADRREIARRYVEDIDSSVTLAKDYGVNQRTIRKALVRAGVTIRSRSETTKLRWEAEKNKEEQQ
jgi:hypothetical protein